MGEKINQIPLEPVELEISGIKAEIEDEKRKTGLDWHENIDWLKKIPDNNNLSFHLRVVIDDLLKGVDYKLACEKLHNLFELARGKTPYIKSDMRDRDIREYNVSRKILDSLREILQRYWRELAKDIERKKDDFVKTSIEALENGLVKSDDVSSHVAKLIEKLDERARSRSDDAAMDREAGTVADAAAYGDLSKREEEAKLDTEIRARLKKYIIS